MLKKFSIYAFGLLMLAASVLSNSASAGLLGAGDIIRLNDSFGTTGGGEFILDRKVGGAWNGDDDYALMNVFCGEKNEFVSFTGGISPDYKVFSVTDRTKNGGVNTGNYAGPSGITATGDILDAKSRWLYYNFAQGTLAGYTYTAGAARIASANLLQKAFWYFENEENFSANAFIAAAIAEEAAYASSFYTGNFGVAQGKVGVANLVAASYSGAEYPSNSSGFVRQDQLVLVPEPGSILIWGLVSATMVGVVYSRHRRVA